jgi:GWxTD domain-containing protein
MPVFIPFLDDDLWTGGYIVETYLLVDAQDTLIKDFPELQKKALSFYSHPLAISVQRGIPLAGVDIDDGIQQLTYIATGFAYDSLMRADTKQEKRKAIMEFWNHRNPYPEDPYNQPMQVFYKRLAYVNQNFKGSLPGWRTDRGRVYLQLGEPTSIERHPYEVNQRPYEIWEYYDLSLRYYFVDQFLIGDYRMVSIPPANGIFNWQRESR